MTYATAKEAPDDNANEFVMFSPNVAALFSGRAFLANLLNNFHAGQTGNKGQTNYAASKAGVIAFTKSAAKELAKFDVRVNCICPGFIRTPMVDTIPEHVIQLS